MQSYTEIPSSQSLQSSLALLLNNDKTALSLNSGTAFPTTNLQVGMACLRTDQMRLYVLRDMAPTWVEIANLNATNWNSSNHGVGSGLNADMVDGIHAATTATANQLLALDASAKLPASITGDAATVAGRSVGNAANNVPLSNGTMNTNLNAEMLAGRRAGTINGDIPISNGTICANLNADLLDGYHASSFVRTIQGVAPDASGNVSVDLASRLALTGGTMSGGITTTANSMMVGSAGGAIRGYLYNDTSGIGLLNSGEGWALRVPMGTSNVEVTGALTIAGVAPLTAVGGALERSGNTVSLNPIRTATVFQTNGNPNGTRTISVDAYGRVTATTSTACDCTC